LKEEELEDFDAVAFVAAAAADDDTSLALWTVAYVAVGGDCDGTDGTDGTGAGDDVADVVDAVEIEPCCVVSGTLKGI
jgi:hypothetical protein